MDDTKNVNLVHLDFASVNHRLIGYELQILNCSTKAFKIVMTPSAFA